MKQVFIYFRREVVKVIGTCIHKLGSTLSRQDNCSGQTWGWFWTWSVILLKP